ncbi:Hypothetical predicted protein [Lecanosticta acicola]|uniref:Uncharacterized protein n=1 Tax=Lecanosticta acicola TaxID=111012 RepID=A0AAI8YTB8_9PEZI|nr:Hypothetical predicted protein [Lecanosticta acicola]
MAAFSCALKQNPPTSSYRNMGIKHHQACLRHLQCSLGDRTRSQPDAVLGAIILLITLDCITGDSSAWRTHVRGGRKWLQTARSKLWKGTDSMSTLYQIFSVLEAIGGAAHGLEDFGGDLASDYTYDSILGVCGTTLHQNYRLDSLYGLTQPILEAIIHINKLDARPMTATSQEVENLRIKILLNDPRGLCLDDVVDSTERELVRHHACVFYFACQIHYERTIHRVTPESTQDLVTRALEHLEAIAGLEIHLNVAGLMWPVFVTACEAESDSIRKRFHWYFGKGQKHGIQGISAGQKVVQEVWRRRDACSAPDKASIRWQQVMVDLRLDLLLT